MVSGGEVKRVNAKFFLTVRDAQSAVEQWAQMDMAQQVEMWVQGKDLITKTDSAELSNMYIQAVAMVNNIDIASEPFRDDWKKILTSLHADTTRALNQVAVVEVTEEECGTENAQFGAMALARNFMMQLTLAVRMYAAAEERAIKEELDRKHTAEKRVMH